MFSKFGAILIVSTLFVFGGSFFVLHAFSQGTPSMQKAESMAFERAKKETIVPIAKPASPMLLFGGDMMFDRYIRTVMNKKGNDFPLTSLQEIFLQADVVVANLEGPITDNPSVSETSVIGTRDNYFFTFDPVVAGVLRDAHIDVVNIGNNHILNFKEEGVVQTKKHLMDARVQYFGSPLLGDERIVVRDIKGTTIAFVSYNEFVWQGEEKAFQDIRTATEEADVVVLYTHWGTEYVPATQSVKQLARQFIDAGADLIIGSHPHVVQENEVYQGKTIYYSLGNLVFDQYGSLETTQGLLVRAVLDTDTKSFTFEDVPIILKNTGQTVLEAK